MESEVARPRATARRAHAARCRAKGGGSLRVVFRAVPGDGCAGRRRPASRSRPSSASAAASGAQRHAGGAPDASRLLHRRPPSPRTRPSLPYPAPPARPDLFVYLIDALRADRLGAYGGRRGLTPRIDAFAAARAALRAGGGAGPVDPAGGGHRLHRPRPAPPRRDDARRPPAGGGRHPRRAAARRRLPHRGLQHQRAPRRGHRLRAGLRPLRGAAARDRAPRRSAAAPSPGSTRSRRALPSSSTSTPSSRTPPTRPPPTCARASPPACGRAPAPAPGSRPPTPRAAPSGRAASPTWRGSTTPRWPPPTAPSAPCSTRSPRAGGSTAPSWRSLADHGEAFDERGALGHAHDLHAETLRIPLIVKLPRQREGKRLAAPAQQLDIAPTLLAAAGLGAAPELPGADLARLARLARLAAAGDAAPWRERPAFSHLSYEGRRGIAVTAGAWKLIQPLPGRRRPPAAALRPRRRPRRAARPRRRQPGAPRLARGAGARRAAGRPRRPAAGAGRDRRGGAARPRRARLPVTRALLAAALVAAALGRCGLPAWLSPKQAEPASLVDWVWSGAVTPDGAVVKAKVACRAQRPPPGQPARGPRGPHRLAAGAPRPRPGRRRHLPRQRPPPGDPLPLRRRRRRRDRLRAPRPLPHLPRRPRLLHRRLRLLRQHRLRQRRVGRDPRARTAPLPPPRRLPLRGRGRRRPAALPAGLRPRR